VIIISFISHCFVVQQTATSWQDFVGLHPSITHVAKFQGQCLFWSSSIWLSYWRKKIHRQTK
jgi:hypothetical protein